jgi:hypothetical protein
MSRFKDYVSYADKLQSGDDPDKWDQLAGIGDHVGRKRARLPGGHMAIHISKSYWLAFALVPLAAMAGCCCQIIVPVASDQFGPNAESRGPGPTCCDGCQCNSCVATPDVDPGLCGDATTGACVSEFRTVPVAAPEQSARSNPFRSQSGTAENQLPLVKSELAPTESAATKTESRNLSVLRASAERAIPPTLTLAPPANAPGAHSLDPQAINLAGSSLKQPNALPAIDDAKPISRKETHVKWRPPKYIPNAIAATALVTAEKRVVDVPSAAAHLAKNPSMSKRVADHLRNNLQL